MTQRSMAPLATAVAVAALAAVVVSCSSTRALMTRCTANRDACYEAAVQFSQMKNDRDCLRLPGKRGCQALADYYWAHACVRGHHDGCWMLYDRVLLTGGNGVSSVAVAAKGLAKNCLERHIKSCRRLASHFNDEGGDYAPEKSLELLSKACEFGDETSCGDIETIRERLKAREEERRAERQERIRVAEEAAGKRAERERREREAAFQNAKAKITPLLAELETSLEKLGQKKLGSPDCTFASLATLAAAYKIVDVFRVAGSGMKAQLDEELAATAKLTEAAELLSANDRRCAEPVKILKSTVKRGRIVGRELIFAVRNDTNKTIDAISFLARFQNNFGDRATDIAGDDHYSGIWQGKIRPGGTQIVRATLISFPTATKATILWTRIHTTDDVTLTATHWNDAGSSPEWLREFLGR